MATMSARAEPINRDIALFLDGLSPSLASKSLAEMAAEAIADAADTNTRALGRRPPSKTFVDGNEGASLESVRPDGVIVTEFELLSEVLDFIGRRLEQFSPVKSGRYKRSHILLADNIEVDIHTPTTVPNLLTAEEFVFINTRSYARRIERGSSTQAPDGVYQAVAMIARRRFGKIAKILFSFRTIVGEDGNQRNPAIIVRIS